MAEVTVIGDGDWTIVFTNGATAGDVDVELCQRRTAFWRRGLTAPSSEVLQGYSLPALEPLTISLEPNENLYVRNRSPENGVVLVDE